MKLKHLKEQSTERSWQDHEERRLSHRRETDQAFRQIVKHLLQTQKAVRAGDTKKADRLLSVAINALSRMFMR
jgi:hypothetical protein